MRITEAASSHFVIALIQMPQREPLLALREARQLLYLHSSHEFNYHQARPHQKALFFEQVADLSFHVRAVVVAKSFIRTTFQSYSGPALLNEFTAQLIMRSSDREIADDILLIDGGVPSTIKHLRVRLSELCHQRQRSRPFKKIISADSKRDDGLQLADMVAGAIMHWTKSTDDVYYKTFADKVVDLWKVKGEGQ